MQFFPLLREIRYYKLSDYNIKKNVEKKEGLN